MPAQKRERILARPTATVGRQNEAAVASCARRNKDEREEEREERGATATSNKQGPPQAISSVREGWCTTYDKQQHWSTAQRKQGQRATVSRKQFLLFTPVFRYVFMVCVFIA